MTSTDSLFNTALQAHALGNFDFARLHYLAVLRGNPTHLKSLINLSDLLNKQNQVAAGAALMARAVTLQPQNGQLWNNLGNFLTRAERYDDAELALDQAQEFSPDNIAVWHNSLLLAYRQGKLDEAFKHYKQILDLGGDSLIVQNDLAHIYLSSGDLQHGLEAYEARWAILSHLEPWDLHVPEWQGEDLLGKHILIHAEQGFGDTIMTSRFVRKLVDTHGAQVTFGVEPATIALYEAQGWPVEVCNARNFDHLASLDLDFHSPLYSMMRWLNIEREDISPRPYLKAPQIAVPPVLNGAYNVGICWFSGKRHNHMDWRRRVSPLEPWLMLAEAPKIQLWSLCPGDEAQAEIMKIGAEGVVLDEVTRFESFAETAAFIEKLDLVVSVDTAVAHLAAAMGKPTWMLSQFTPCWRWWEMAEQSGLPWYDSMVVMPQHVRGDWKSQLEICKNVLETRPQSLAQRAAA